MSMSTARDSLAQLSESVAARMGLHFPPERWADLERGVRAATRELGFEDAESCIRELASAPLSSSQIETLARHLTVGETYFWREKQSLEVLQNHILPRLIEARRDRAPDQKTLRIWSAGCCTGEEPYSIAMLLSNMIPDRHNWNLTVIATDINSHFLGKAEAGVYREWSFRGAPPWLKEKYFKKTPEGHYRVVTHIREMVSFSTLNLVEDIYPSILNNTHAMDVILCRNVLIYLTAESTRTVTHNLYRSLVDGGWLIVSPSEASHTLLSEFSTVNFPGAILYQKERKPRTRDGATPRTRDGATPRTRDGATPRTGIHDLPPVVLRALPAPVQNTFTNVGWPTASELPQTAPNPPAIASPPEEGSTPGEKVTRNSETSPVALVAQARAYANGGQLTEALECCTRVIAGDKMNPVGHYLHATILQEQGAVAEAVAALKRALYLDHDLVMAHFALGNLARQQGKQKEALKHFENTLTLLRAYRPEDALPESEGLTAGGLAAIIASMIQSEKVP